MSKRFKTNTNHSSNDLAELFFVALGLCVVLAIFI